MNLLEHQAKELLRQQGVPLLKSAVATTPEEAIKIAYGLQSDGVWVVKAQIHAGGRGKAGGIVVARSAADVGKAATQLLGSTLITTQTGPTGELVQAVLIEQGCDIQHEYYLSLTLNRLKKCLTFMASVDGGIHVEESTFKIFTLDLDGTCISYQKFHSRCLAFALGLPFTDTFHDVIHGIYQTFIKNDATLVEINPLILSQTGELYALDAKIVCDNNALYRLPHLSPPAEAAFNYVKLTGSIGCMVNGAGLAMATLDILHQHQGKPANFLDIGGGVTTERVSEAFHIILQDPHVKVVLVNIFGGIVRCDVIAQGIVNAIKDITVPIVIRLEGTHREEGLQLLAPYDTIIIATDLQDAAEKAIAYT